MIYRPSPWKFITFAFGQGISGIGFWMQKAAFGWLAWELTHSPFAVGAVALAEPVATILSAPLAGVMTDRHEPFRLIATTQSLLIVAPLVTLLVHVLGLLSFPVVLLLALADSLAQTFNQPVKSTVIGSLAGPGLLSQAIATNSIAVNTARMIGPALAGIIMVQTGSTLLVFAGAALAFAAVLLVIFALRRDLRSSRKSVPPEEKIPLGEDIRAGFDYIAQTPRIARLFALALIFSLLGRPFTELFPAIAGQVFNSGPELLSAFMSAQGAGALFGALIMLRKRGEDRILKITFGAGLIMSLALIPFSLTDIKWIAVALVGVAGLGHVTCNIGMQSLVQLQTDAAFRGRIVSLYWLIFRGAAPISAAIIGVLASWVPLNILIGSGAALCAIGIAALAAYRRA
ncbi:MFS transporter [Terrihabitans soli]|uniref:MFS transporter n=1 Tax=Terrihabitans soli TaxID=708113 RepID=A0A6S6QI84_9HYPH|nr:MFS transporter [Terrihabitans soli]BCJ89934.1 MFS transporter [Terrihabitans soli]